MVAAPSRLRAGLAVTATALVACVLAGPAPAADHYAGKTIDFIIGADVGGGFDTYARAIARHLGRFIPGDPSVVPKNQPGAGSGRAAAFLYSVAPKDGTVIGAVFPGAIVGPLLDDRAQPLYDPTKFQYLGSADSSARVCITHERSKIKRFEDALAHKTIMARARPEARHAITPTCTRRPPRTSTWSAKGSAEMFLAMERGEVDGMRLTEPVRQVRLGPQPTVNIRPGQPGARGGAQQARRPADGNSSRTRTTKAVELIRPAGVRPVHHATWVLARRHDPARAFAATMWTRIPRRRSARASTWWRPRASGATARRAALRRAEGDGRTGEGSVAKARASVVVPARGDP
jgi:hypothetical protein